MLLDRYLPALTPLVFFLSPTAFAGCLPRLPPDALPPAIGDPRRFGALLTTGWACSSGSPAADTPRVLAREYGLR
jgi:hypothetical protein